MKVEARVDGGVCPDYRLTILLLRNWVSPDVAPCAGGVHHYNLETANHNYAQPNNRNRWPRSAFIRKSTLDAPLLAYGLSSSRCTPAAASTSAAKEGSTRP